MLALFIPLLLLILVILTVILLFKKKWKATITLFTILLIVNWWSECISFKFWRLNEANASNHIKIISFNIDGSTGDNDEKSRQILNFLKQYSPDIVFIAEFNEQYPKPLNEKLSKNFAYTTYPGFLYFHYFYSNYPILNSRRILNRKGEDIGVYACSIVIRDDTIDMYGCHFASNNYNDNLERQALEDIQGLDGFFNYLRNIRSSGNRRKIEAEAITREMSKSSHQSIVLGDMNDVCGSAPIHKLQSIGLRDAWWDRGIGYGATFHHPLPYRIDHIMHTAGLKLEVIKVLDSNGISDHDALYAEYSIER